MQTLDWARSQAEYGPRQEVLKEELPLKPATVYAVAKVASAMITAKMSEIVGMRHTWVRLVAVYGPGDDPKHLIPFTIRTLLAGKKPALTKGEQRWDYLYVEDAARRLPHRSVGSNRKSEPCLGANGCHPEAD